MISYYKKKNYKLKKLDLRNSKKIILGVESNESIKCFNIRMIIFQSIFLFKKKKILIYVHKYIYIYKKMYTLKENEPCVILNSNIAVMMNVCTLCKIWISMFNDVVKKFPNEVLYVDTLFLWNDITRKKTPELQDSFLDAKMYLCHIQVTPNGSNVGPSEFLISQS